MKVKFEYIQRYLAPDNFYYILHIWKFGGCITVEIKMKEKKMLEGDEYL